VPRSKWLRIFWLPLDKIPYLLPTKSFFNGYRTYTKMLTNIPPRAGIKKTAALRPTAAAKEPMIQGKTIEPVVPPPVTTPDMNPTCLGKMLALRASRPGLAKETAQHSSPQN